MDHELDKVIAGIDDRDADAEQWLNGQALSVQPAQNPR